MIEHIKETACPHCGAKVKSESRQDQHCNGHWNEYREFSCGFKLHFIPNFMEVFPKTECKNSEEVINRVKVDKKFLKELVTSIEENKDISEDLKANLVDTLKYVRA